ncbi:serine hydrolase [Nibrella saemangeumensis]|uniref:Serine hydrolase n=1 Tax=Nibrella saemangeumensis TaxID=1084526 RepID=A0ABP8MTS0_9BACT
MRPTTLILTCISIFMLQPPAIAQSQPTNTYPGNSWQKADNKALGWSDQKLQDAAAYAQSLGPGGLMVVDGGRVVMDCGDTDYRSKIASVRKSLLSALYGIHVRAGRIDLNNTLDQLGIDDNAPSLSPTEKQATIRMLLQARSGIYHNSVGNTPSMQATRPGRGSHLPGTFWYYNNWDFNALGTLFEQQTHTKIPVAFLEQIARPLQMQDFTIDDFYYSPGDESIHPAYHFRMTVRDLARFGYLYLRKGKWLNLQIIPADWILESTQPYSDAGESGGYGYLWWVAQNGKHFPGVTLKDGSYSAWGAGGKFIVILPDRDLVVVYCTNVDYPDHAAQMAAADIPKGVNRSEMGHLLNLIFQAKLKQF